MHEMYCNCFCQVSYSLKVVFDIFLQSRGTRPLADVHSKVVFDPLRPFPMVILEFNFRIYKLKLKVSQLPRKLRPTLVEVAI
jgi:hypothetical protein